MQSERRVVSSRARRQQQVGAGAASASETDIPLEVLQEPRRPSGPLDALPGDIPPRSSTGDSGIECTYSLKHFVSFLKHFIYSERQYLIHKHAFEKKKVFKALSAKIILLTIDY